MYIYHYARIRQGRSNNLSWPYFRGDSDWLCNQRIADGYILFFHIDAGGACVQTIRPGPA